MINRRGARGIIRCRFLFTAAALRRDVLALPPAGLAHAFFRCGGGNVAASRKTRHQASHLLPEIKQGKQSQITYLFSKDNLSEVAKISANCLSAQGLRGNAVEPFDLYSPLIDADPFPFYAELRERYPCYWSDSGQLWILSRYDDIVEAARDWQTFSSSAGNMIDELPGRAGATLGTTDPPRHDRLAGPQPGGLSQAKSRPHGRADAGDRRSLA